MGPAAGGGRFDILPISCGECLRLDARSAACPDRMRRARGGFLRGPGGLVAGAAHARRCRVRCRSPAAGCCSWATSWPTRSSRDLRLPPSADPLVALAIRAPAAWIRDRRSGRGWVVAEPGYEHLLERLARGCASSRGMRPMPSRRASRCARKSRRGFCARSRARSSTSPPAMCIRPTCRGAGRAAAARPSIRRRSTDGCAPPIPVRSQRSCARAISP